MSTRLVQVPTGDQFELHAQRIVIGRREDCDIVLRHATISAHHCALQHSEQDGRWHVQDLGSKNGTMVNGLVVTDSPLVPGDIIGLGKSLRLRFECIE